jgi:hypothetical protein
LKGPYTATSNIHKPNNQGSTAVWWACRTHGLNFPEGHGVGHEERLGHTYPAGQTPGQ